MVTKFIFFVAFDRLDDCFEIKDERKKENTVFSFG